MVTRPDDPFPGHHRPGLIEASSCVTACSRMARHFRGIIAPASLKQVVGSLDERHALSFPGHHRPGLIEALRPARFPVDGLGSISGASSPRPH